MIVRILESRQEPSAFRQPSDIISIRQRDKDDNTGHTYELMLDGHLLGTFATGTRAKKARVAALRDLQQKRVFIVREQVDQDNQPRWQVWRLCLADTLGCIMRAPKGYDCIPGCADAIHCNCERSEYGPLRHQVDALDNLKDATASSDARQTDFHERCRRGAM